MQVNSWSTAGYITVGGGRILTVETEIIPLCLCKVDKMQDLSVYGGKLKKKKTEASGNSIYLYKSEAESTVMTSKTMEQEITNINFVIINDLIFF